MNPGFRSAIAMFGAEAKRKLANLTATGQPEDQLRAPLERLVVDLAEICGFPRTAVVAVGESSLSELKTRPEVATRLRGARAGLLSGAALLVDYALTIAISVASGADAVFSLLPVGALEFKLITAAALVCLLTVLNLRGIKESITVLLPIFLGFFVSHAYLIAQGIHAHREAIPRLFDAMLAETHSISLEHGWLFIAAILLRAYSLGGGTYTGLEPR